MRREQKAAWASVASAALAFACSDMKECHCPSGHVCAGEETGVAHEPDAGGDGAWKAEEAEPADARWDSGPEGVTDVPNASEAGSAEVTDLSSSPEAMSADRGDPTDVVEVLPRAQEGTPESPYTVSAFPFVQENDTSLAATGQLDVYACADWLGEEGPELYYQVTLPSEGTLKVEVLEADGVDVDIHLLSGLASEEGTATECIERANTQLAVENLAAGSYWVVIDSYSQDGEVFDGAFRVAFELDVWDEWQIRELEPGLVWKKKIYADYCGGTQTINTLEVDLKDPGLQFKPYWENACIHPSEAGEAEGARAALNAGFFAVVEGCPALCLVKIDGEMKVPQHLDGEPRRAFGLDVGGQPMFGDVPAWTDWPEAFQAISGHPNLVTDGEIDIVPWQETGFYTGRHPRTGLGLTADGRLLLVTVDGRTEAGEGMTLPEFAQHFLYLGAVQAINLDGGGSTTMWLPGQSINGVVNHPSDNEKADHWGERAVSDALLIL